MAGLDGEWQFDCTGCSIIQNGSVVISFGNASGESDDGRYYWTCKLDIQGNAIRPSTLSVQNPGHTKTFCSFQVSGTIDQGGAVATGTQNGRVVSIRLHDRSLGRS